MVDLWLFARRVTPSALAICAVLTVSAVILNHAHAWPEHSLLDCFVKAVYMMKGEAVDLPKQWWLELMVLLLPLVGLVLAAEGLVRATVLFVDRSQRQGEWNMVVASTYAGHTLVCGMGQFGATVCGGLLARGRKVVGVDLNEHLATVVTARRQKVPVIIGDMTNVETLMEANIKRACCVIISSGDDLSNIEAAIRVHDLNPGARLFVRLYKTSLADLIKEALRFEIETFSPDDSAARTILDTLEIGESD